MGVGFCVIVDPAGVDAVLSVVSGHGKRASVIGHVIEDSERAVQLPQKRLKGVGKEFRAF
jgi:phosphoribosylaminoimidazole (AIR) synthetase